MRSPLLIRSVALFVPLLATWALLVLRRGDRPVLTGALLASVWNLPALLGVHLLASHFGWWRFEASGGVFLGMPVDLYLGWALLWGAIPVLVFYRVNPLLAAALFLWFDLLVMPLGRPVLQLGQHWVFGEVVAVLTCALPALLLGQWTAGRQRLPLRASLQVVAFSALALGLLPAVVLQRTGGPWPPAVLSQPTWILALALQALAVPAVVGLSAVQEFAQRGGGTPVPFDPPQRLVRSGPYAYLTNPMQLSMTLLMLGLGWLLQSWWVAAAAIVTTAFASGFAAWHEDGELLERYDARWREYRQAVRPWFPRWRPAPTLPPATLYFARTCLACSAVGRWFQRRNPRGLNLLAAEDAHGRTFERLTYVPNDGTADEVGVGAFARALEHINLAWAFLGWTMRLPGLRWILQVFVDAVGGGARRIPMERPA